MANKKPGNDFGSNALKDIKDKPLTWYNPGSSVPGINSV
jgi:hypothetical protein